MKNSKTIKNVKPGFYTLTSDEEPEPCLVHVYNCTDLGGELSIGFNCHDGGGVMPISHLSQKSTLTEVIFAEKGKLSASEAVYGFAAYLTCRDSPITASAKHDAAPMADLVAAFIQSNKLDDPRDNFADNLTHPKNATE